MAMSRVREELQRGRAGGTSTATKAARVMLLVWRID